MAADPGGRCHFRGNTRLRPGRIPRSCGNRNPIVHNALWPERRSPTIPPCLWHDHCDSPAAGTGCKTRNDMKISESPESHPTNRPPEGARQGVSAQPSWSCRSEQVSLQKKLNTPGQRRRGRWRRLPGLPQLPWTREGGSTAAEGDLEGRLPRTCPFLICVHAHAPSLALCSENCGRCRANFRPTRSFR